MKMFFVYIIQSLIDSSFYIGYTADLPKRIEEHNSGKSNYTASLKPWEVVYIEEFPTKREAMIREKFLKKQKNRDFYLCLIKSER